MIKESFSLKTKPQFGDSPATLNQWYSLIKQLQNDDHLSAHWIIETDPAFQKLKHLPMKDYKHILALLFNRKYIQLNKVLEDLRFVRHPKSYDVSEPPF